jgi:hypothetical protein
MAQQKLELQLKGLYTSPNNLSSVPQGSLEIADNVVIDKPNIIESRRGQTQYGNPLTIGSGQVNKIFNYASSMITHYDDKMAYDSGSGVFVPYSGTYSAPTSTLKMKSLEALKNFYFTTSEGVYKIDAIANTPKRAGVVKALSGTYATSGSSGFLVADSAVAYRLVWGYIDANDNLLLGAPSQRIVAANTNGYSVDVSLSYLIPDTITTDYFYQIYRSTGTATAADEPDDELQLVAQGIPTAGEIAAKTFTVIDSTPYSLMRATIYTAPSQEGISNSNNEPPFAVDMDIFKGSAFYANILQKQKVTATLIAAGYGALGYSTTTSAIHTNTTLDGLLIAATLTKQNLIYTADTSGISGNDITVAYTAGGTAGAEVVTVVGNAISVQIQSGVSTNTQIKTAVDASVAASALISCATTGGAGVAQVTSSAEFLTGGFDTTLLRIGMKVVRADVPTDTRILTITSTSAVVMTKAATATTSGITTEFQDRITVADVDYWAGSANNVSTNTFLATSSGTPGENIDATALSFIQIVNTSASNTTVYGYYISGLQDLPGQILFEERTIGGAAFNLTSSDGESFSPTLPNNLIITGNTLANPTVVTSIAHGLTNGASITITGSNSTPSIDGTHTITYIGVDTFSIPVNVTVAGTAGYIVADSTIIQSTNDAKQNRVAISKPSQVEAVPSYTYFDIGSANFGIQRVIALRDGIFFLKADGIYRLSGESFSSYTVTLVDSTTALQVPESAVAFNNQVFCFSDQGVCAITDSGVQILSVPIESDLLELASSQYTNFRTASFGIAYESSRQYMFFTVTNTTDTFATQAFIYNTLTKSWTRWVMNRTCGIVNTATNKLIMAKADTGQILQERKDYTVSDYADEQYSVTVNSIDSATTMTLASVALISIGMTISQNSLSYIITDIVGSQITIENTTGFTATTATVYTPIANHIQWSPIDIENPGILKQFSEVSFFFRNAAFRSIEADFQSNVIVESVSVDITNFSLRGWGQFGWGDTAWGGSLGGQSVLRTYVPREQQRCSWLTIGLRTEESFTGFSLQGVSIIYNTMSSRMK